MLRLTGEASLLASVGLGNSARIRTAFAGGLRWRDEPPQKPAAEEPTPTAPPNTAQGAAHTASAG